MLTSFCTTNVSWVARQMGYFDALLVILNSRLTCLAHLVLVASKHVPKDPLKFPVNLELPRESFPGLNSPERLPHIKATQAELLIHSISHIHRRLSQASSRVTSAVSLTIQINLLTQTTSNIPTPTTRLCNKLSVPRPTDSSNHVIHPIRPSRASSRAPSDDLRIVLHHRSCLRPPSHHVSNT